MIYITRPHENSNLYLIDNFELKLPCTKCVERRKFHLDGKTFVVKKFNNGVKTRMSIFVGMEEEPQNKAYPPSKNRYPFPLVKRDIHFDTALVKEIVLKTLSKKRESFKAKSAYLSISFTFKRDGKVEGAFYALYNEANITLAEIADIDKKLKSGSIKASFTGRAYLDYEYIHYPSFDVFF